MFFGTTLTGLTIHATDGEIGKIKDVYFTDAWKLQFIIADTRKWLPGKKVLLPFQVLQKIGAEEGYVRVTEDKEAIRLGEPVPDGERLTPYHQRAILDYFNWNQFKNNIPSMDLLSPLTVMKCNCQTYRQDRMGFRWMISVMN